MIYFGPNFLLQPVNGGFDVRVLCVIVQPPIKPTFYLDEVQDGAGGGGAGREMMDSNTSLPAILTPKHFFAVSAICFDRSDFACTCFSGKFLVHKCG